VGYVLEAIDALAATNTVHGNLAPARLSLAARSDGSHSIKVDTGVTKVEAKYRSPEAQTGLTLDARADVWSLGAILFELLTARFSAAIAEAADPKSLRTIRSDVPPELESVVMRCLRTELALRYASLHELREALAPFAEIAPASKKTTQHGVAPPAVLENKNLAPSIAPGEIDAAWGDEAPAPAQPAPAPPPAPAGCSASCR